MLGNRQRFALGHANLPGHQIKAGNGLGNRVLDLQARVHFHEEELAASIQQKLHRARTDVADGLGCTHRRFAHGPAQFGAQAGGRGLFDDFLVAALNRTVAFVQIQAVAVLVGEHLNFHVARLEHVLFHQHSRVAE